MQYKTDYYDHAIRNDVMSLFIAYVMSCSREVTDLKALYVSPLVRILFCVTLMCSYVSSFLLSFFFVFFQL